MVITREVCKYGRLFNIAHFLTVVLDPSRYSVSQAFQTLESYHPQFNNISHITVLDTLKII